jgi:hypothetical protein
VEGSRLFERERLPLRRKVKKNEVVSGASAGRLVLMENSERGAGSDTAAPAAKTLLLICLSDTLGIIPVRPLDDRNGASAEANLPSLHVNFYLSRESSGDGREIESRGQSQFASLHVGSEQCHLHCLIASTTRIRLQAPLFASCFLPLGPQLI